MLTTLKKITGQNTASARVVDGKLILSFPHARTPVVWQMDLSEVKASALEVLENKNKDGHTLTLKTPKGEKLDAAEFENRQDAVNGLMAASHALENAHGNIRPAKNTDNQGKTAANTNANPAKPGRWVAGLLGLALLVALFGAWSATAPQTPNSYRPQGTLSPTAANAQSAAANAAGVPVSADDFLNGL